MPQPRRFGQVIGLAEESIAEYIRVHREVWPEVLEQIERSHITNYSIFLRRLPDGNNYLFSYFEYKGTDFDMDMEAMAADPKTQEWWAICGPMQRPLEDRGPSAWWAEMEEVFHHD